MDLKLEFSSFKFQVLLMYMHAYIHNKINI